MYEKIFFPADFSEVSRKALEHIKKLKTLGADEVVVFHVIDDRTQLPLAYMESVHAQQREEAKRNMAALARELEDAGLKVRTAIRVGVPVREILAAEKEFGEFSLLVMGSHGKSNVLEMMIGSVAEKVVRKCKSPVLVVKR